MADAKILVLFYTTYGTNHLIGEAAADAAKGAGAEVRLRRVKETAPREVVEGQDKWKAQLEKMKDIPEVSLDDMEWANGYFLSCPTRYGVPASQMRAFIDTLGGLWGEGKLADKVATATTSAQNMHGGQETTLQSLYVTFMHWGAILVPPGYTDDSIYATGGNPYGFSAKAGEVGETEKAAIAHQARRLVKFAQRLT